MSCPMPVFFVPHGGDYAKVPKGFYRRMNMQKTKEEDEEEEEEEEE